MLETNWACDLQVCLPELGDLEGHLSANDIYLCVLYTVLSL